MNPTNQNQSPNSPKEVQRPILTSETATEARGNMDENRCNIGENQCRATKSQCSEPEEFTAIPADNLFYKYECNYCHIKQCLLEDEENKLIELLQYKEQLRAKRNELDKEYEKLQYFASELLRFLTSVNDQKQMDPDLEEKD